MIFQGLGKSGNFEIHPLKFSRMSVLENGAPSYGPAAGLAAELLAGGPAPVRAPRFTAPVPHIYSVI